MKYKHHTANEQENSSNKITSCPSAPFKRSNAHCASSLVVYVCSLWFLTLPINSRKCWAARVLTRAAEANKEAEESRRCLVHGISWKYLHCEFSNFRQTSRNKIFSTESSASWKCYSQKPLQPSDGLVSPQKVSSQKFGPHGDLRARNFEEIELTKIEISLVKRVALCHGESSRRQFLRLHFSAFPFVIRAKIKPEVLLTNVMLISKRKISNVISLGCDDSTITLSFDKRSSKGVMMNDAIFGMPYQSQQRHR